MCSISGTASRRRPTPTFWPGWPTWCTPSRSSCRLSSRQAGPAAGAWISGGLRSGHRVMSARLGDMNPTTAQPHVVIVGGGIAGLAAALFLRDEPVRVTVLEGSPRLGGKLSVSEGAGVPLDE